LILIAFVLAVPVSWYAMGEWLAQFPYKIDIGGDVFFFSGAMMVIAVWMTVSYQSVKTAMTNPKDVLVDE
jgi:putative ABC transport system permease protein